MKKGKRLLSAILAVLLIVGMIPVAASADGEGVPTATISVGTLPSWWNDEVADEESGSVLGALLDYGDLVELPRNYTLDDMKAKVAEINSFYTPIAGKGDSEGNPYQVNKGDTFYLALDMSYEPADKGGYNGSPQYAVETPRGVFKLAEDYGTLTNPVISSLEWMNRNARTQYVAGAENYHPGQTPFDLAVVFTEETKDASGNETSRYKFSFANGSGIIPNAATWDGILVLEATGAAGVYKVEVAKDNVDTNSYLEGLGASGAISSLVTTQKGWQTSAGSNAFNAVDSTDNENLPQSAIQTKPIYIEIVSNDPAISIVANQKLNPVDDTIEVTLKNGTFKDADATKFWVKDSNGDADKSAVKSVSLNGDKTVATLTVEGAKLTAGDNYYIEADKDNIQAGDAPANNLKTSNTFTVKAALTGTPTIAGTLTYGQTLTATHNTNASNVTYKWYRDTTPINGATSATYKLDKADIGKTIKVEVSDADGTLYGTAKSADNATTVAKIQLSRPASGDLGISVDPVLQNATSGLTKTATYKFTTGVINGDNVTVNVTATYTDVATTGPKTLTGATMSDTLATGGDWYTLAAANSEEYTVSGTVNPAGYSLAKETTNGKTITWESPIDNANPYVGVPGPEGKANGTVEGLGASEKLTSLTAKNKATGATVGSVVITDEETGKFTWTAPTTAISGLVEVTFTESSASEKDVTATIPAKEYDGTTAVVGTITLSEDVGFVVTGGTYDTAEVGTDKTVTLAVTGDTTIVDGATTYHLVTTAKGEIKKITDPTIKATVADNTLRGTSSIDDVLKAIKEATVKLDGVTYPTDDGKENEGTVGDYFNDEAIKALLKDIEGVSYEVDDEGNETWSFSGLANKDLDLNFDLSAIATGELAKHAELTGAKLAFHTKFRRNTTSSTTGVNLDAGGYGTVDTEVAELDDEGHVVELPTVKTKAGVVFLGWTDEEGSDKLIDPETKVLEEDDTLYAVYAGYVAGDGNGKVRPAANVLRKELARMLLVAAGLYDRNEDYTAKAENNFPDMPKDGWSDNYLARAKELGIMNGDAETGKARPNAPINREEAAVMIVKTFKVMTENGATTDKLADFDKVSDWAQKFVAALYNNGTVNGYPEEEGENTFRPKTNISRQEVAVMINKYLGVTPAKAADIKADTAVKNPFTDIKATDWSYAHVMFASLSVPYTYYEDEITQPTRDE